MQGIAIEPKVPPNGERVQLGRIVLELFSWSLHQFTIVYQIYKR